MYALSPPNFNFKIDAQAMYGSNKYTKNQWEQICNFIEAKLPKYKVLRENVGNINDWSGSEHFLYHLGEINEKIFPYFNNGAILIRNSFSKELKVTLENYTFRYIEYLKKHEGINHQVSVGQDMIGIAIDNCVKEWQPFEPGFNFIVQNSFEKSRLMLDSFDIKNVKLFHYINVPKGSIYEKIVLNKYKEVRKKYYSIWKLLP